MPTFDEPSHPMLKVYADIGTITKGIENLEKGQGRVEDEIVTLQGRVSNLVTKEECESRHPRSKYKTTESRKVGGLLQRVAENAGNITKILTLIASVGIGLWAIHKFSTRLEATLERAEVKSEKTTREIVEKIEKRPPPRVIYVPVPVTPDAGAPSPRRRRVTPR